MPAPTSSPGPASLALLCEELVSSYRAVVRLAALSALTLAVAAVAFHGAGIATGSWRVLPVLSGSMQPTFGPGDAVLVTRAPLSSVRAGDVIAYHVPVGDRQLTTHRVVEVLRGGAHPVVRTKGDANDVADPWRARLSGDALWRVDATVPHVGAAYTFARTPAARSAVVWVVVALLLLIGLRRVWRRNA